MNMSPILNVMVQAVRKAARIIQRDFGEIENLQISRKGPGDFVTKSDKKVEQTLYDELSKVRPGYGFLMEERGEVKGEAGNKFRWIIDPIDGTMNFLHGMPYFAISVALEQAGELIAGVVYDPIMDELFHAERTKGAFLNGRRLRVAARNNLNTSIIACGIPHLGRGDKDIFLRELTSLQDEVAGVRRCGAASLDLAYVAAGRYDGFWERGLAPWDIAAGVLIVREAGGRVGTFDGRSKVLNAGQLLASNDILFDKLSKKLMKV